MKHQAKGKKLGRKRDQRKALMKSLMNSFIRYGKMETTETKAKEIRPKIEKLITKAKKDTLANRKVLLKILNKQSVKKMMEEIGPRYQDRKGGYTRIIKLGARKGDAGQKAIIELT